MNEPNPSQPIDPELEARIAALVLGEASDFECDQLNQMIEDRPELQALRAELESTDRLLRAAGSGEWTDDNDDEWKLPADRRKVVLAAISGDVAPDATTRPASLTHDVWRKRWLRTASFIAASLFVVLTLGSVMYMQPMSARREDFEQAPASMKGFESAAPLDGAQPNFMFGGTAEVAGDSVWMDVETAAVPDLDVEFDTNASLSAIEKSLDSIQSMPSQYYLQDDVQYFPATPQIVLSDEEEATLPAYGLDAKAVPAKRLSDRRARAFQTAEPRDFSIASAAPTTGASDAAGAPQAGQALEMPLGEAQAYGGIALNYSMDFAESAGKKVQANDFGMSGGMDMEMGMRMEMEDAYGDGFASGGFAGGGGGFGGGGGQMGGALGGAQAITGGTLAVPAAPAADADKFSQSQADASGFMRTAPAAPKAPVVPDLPELNEMAELSDTPEMPQAGSGTRADFFFDQGSMDVANGTIASADIQPPSIELYAELPMEMDDAFSIEMEAEVDEQEKEIADRFDGEERGKTRFGAAQATNGLGLSTPQAEDFDSDGLMDPQPPSEASDSGVSSSRRFREENRQGLSGPSTTWQYNPPANERFLGELSQPAEAAGEPAVEAAPAPFKGPTPASKPAPTSGGEVSRGIDIGGERLPRTYREDIQHYWRAIVPPESQTADKGKRRLQLDITGGDDWSGYVVPNSKGLSKREKKLSANKARAPEGLNEKLAEKESFSTFSLHVSDVSFKLALAALLREEWPEAAKIRIEEFVNAFDYGDPMPGPDQKVACRLEQSAHPFLQQRNLLRVSMRTAAAGRASTTPLRLTFLLDNSGSMERTDRQQTVRRAFAMLAGQLQPIDQVTLISFARQPRLLADQVSGAKSQELVSVIDNLPSEGGTNIETALQLAFEKAQEQKLDQAQNRIILLTDGAVNLGDADPESLSRMIARMRGAGIAFDAAGICAEGLNDEVLEALTRKGDGRYYLLDSAEAADDGFARQIAGALRPSAKNVKVQVEFNPKRVGRYKLLGFEKHRLKKEDFRNDKVDAAEMAAAEAGVAVYQFEAKPDGEGDVGMVSVRFRDLSSGQMVENRWPIPYQSDAPRLDQAASSLKLAASAALLAAKLRGEPLGASVDLQSLTNLIDSLPEQDRQVQRVQQLQVMIERARQVSGD